MNKSIKLQLQPGIYCISRLEPEAGIPDWVDGDGFVNIARSSEELSLVCKQDRVPLDIRQDNDWACFKFLGPFAFGETGIVLSVIEPLSRNGIGIFVVSTFDGDHLLIKQTDLQAATDHLAAAGHQIQ